MRPFASVVCLMLVCIVPCAAQTTGNACARLKEPIAAASIALPSSGARIDSAELVAPAPHGGAVAVRTAAALSGCRAGRSRILQSARRDRAS